MTKGAEWGWGGGRGLRVAKLFYEVLVDLKIEKMTILAIPNSSFIAHHFIYWFNLAHICYLTSEIKQGVINLNCLLWSGLKVSGLGSRALKVISTAGCTSGNHTRWESAIKGVAQIGCLSFFVFLQKFLSTKKCTMLLDSVHHLFFSQGAVSRKLCY